MKFCKRLLAAVLAALLTLTLLTACEGEAAMPAEEAKAAVLESINHTLLVYGKPQVQEDEQLDRMAELYLEALQTYGDNYYDANLQHRRAELQAETNTMEINGQKIKYSALRSRTNSGRATPIIDGGEYALDHIDQPMDYVGFAMGTVGGSCVVVLWFAQDA